MDWLSTLIGGAIGIVASVGTMILEKIWDRAGRLKIFYMIRSTKNTAVETFGTSESDSGPAFVVPLVFELQNTSNTTRIMRDVSVLMYKDSKYVDEMIQVGHSGMKGEDQQEYGSDNQSYSFVVPAKSIHKVYGTYIYAPGWNPEKRQDFNEIRLRYFNEKDKVCEYHLRYIENPWEQSDMDGDENWILLESNCSYKKQAMDTQATVDEIPFTEEKISYLQMIQEPIGRMSTASAIFKGFAATIVSGIAALTYCDVNIMVLSLSFAPVILFAILDIYYMQLEKKYRHLYEQVRSNKRAINFSMEITKNNKAAKAKIWDCIKSPSIWMFYPAMITILFVVIYMKWKGVI